MEVLQKYNVPLDRIIGICSDRASTMQGVFKGVCTQLATTLRNMREPTVAAIIALNDNGSIPASFHSARGVFVVHCVCHRLALVLTDAIKGTKRIEKVIPEACINLLNGLHDYFARSPARKKEMREYINSENADFIEKQRRAKAERRRAPPGNVIRNPVDELGNILGVLEERHKLPRRIAMTRWLSCGDAVRVAFNCRWVYINYFSNENNEVAESIFELLEDSPVVAW
jgi:hypothetical protein